MQHHINGWLTHASPLHICLSQHNPSDLICEKHCFCPHPFPPTAPPSPTSMQTAPGLINHSLVFSLYLTFRSFITALWQMCPYKCFTTDPLTNEVQCYGWSSREKAFLFIRASCDILTYGLLEVKLLPWPRNMWQPLAKMSSRKRSGHPLQVSPAPVILSRLPAALSTRCCDISEQWGREKIRFLT